MGAGGTLLPVDPDHEIADDEIPDHFEAWSGIGALFRRQWGSAPAPAPADGAR